jgi:hypothetical protein
VIDYFGRCVEPAAQADAILRTWKTIAFMAEGRPIDYRRGFFSSTTAATGMAAYRQSLERRDGNARADASQSRGNGGTRRCGSDDDKGPQEMTVRARHGVVADLASKRTPISSHHIL